MIFSVLSDVLTFKADILAFKLCSGSRHRSTVKNSRLLDRSSSHFCSLAVSQHHILILETMTLTKCWFHTILYKGNNYTSRGRGLPRGGHSPRGTGGCSLKPLPYLWPISVIFPTLFYLTYQKFETAFLWPDPCIKILFQTCVTISSLVQTNVKLLLT